MFPTRPLRSAGATRALVTPLLVIGALWVAPASARSVQDKPDYAGLADDFVRSHISDEQMGNRAPSSISLEDFLELAYIHVDAGVFRIHYPKRGFVDLSGRKKKSRTYRGKPNMDNAARELSAIGVALLDLQQRWVELVGQPDFVLPGYEETREWIQTGWQSKASQKAIKDALTDEKRAWSRKSRPGNETPQARHDVRELITAQGDAERAAAQAFGKAMLTGAYWEGVTVHEREPLSIVLCPTRGDLVGFALYSARAREVPDDSWHPGIWQYTQFHLNGVQAIGFRYAEEGNVEDLYGGKYMSDIDQEDGVVLQHAVQYGSALLLEYYFGPTYVSNDPETPAALQHSQRVMGALFAGTRKFLVTHMYGKNEVRDEGDVASRTNARSQFIAGGNSSGGSLGKSSAETSRWRKRANKEGDFLTDLRDNVEFIDDGGSVARLELKTEGSKRGKGHVVMAPFLARDGQEVLPKLRGPSKEKARDKEKRLRLRAGFGQDYVGFMRAYEIAFYRWLLTDAHPTSGMVAESSARAAHATLFRELATTVSEYKKPGVPLYDLSTQMHGTLDRVYGMPLSWTPGEGSAGDSLERQFLDWVVGSERH